jgi:hypothetical protein
LTVWRRIWGLTYGEAAWLIGGALLLTYELWALATRDGDLLTRAYRDNMRRWWVWPFGWGVLTGHLHGPPIAASVGKWSPAFFVAALVAVLARDLHSKVPSDTVAGPAGLLMIGFVVGAVSWAGRS